MSFLELSGVRKEFAGGVVAVEDFALSACWRPATIRSVVVLPQPLGPTRETSSPRSISRSRLSTATT